MPIGNKPTILKSDGTLDGRLTSQSIRQLYDHIRDLESKLATQSRQMKDMGTALTGSGPVHTVAEIQALLKAGAEHAIGIQSQLGMAAQPQIPYCPIVDALPPLGDPQSQNGSLVVLLTAGNYVIYEFDSRISPGAWTPVTYVPTTPPPPSTVRPAALVYNNTDISITTSGVEQLLTYDSEVYDNDGIHSTSSLTGRLIAVTAGIYIAQLNIGFAQNNTGIRFASIRLNGSPLIGAQATKAVDNGTDRTYISVTAHYQLAVGDYLDSTAYQTSGGALNVSAVNKTPSFGMALVST